jgi:hypothetical protein
VFGFLRFDAGMIESDVDTAKENGDCAAAVQALDGRWFGHRVANAPMTSRTDDTLRACGLLDQASRQFNTALSGNTDAFKSGLNSLRTVLTDLPGHDNMVKHTLDQFLDRLPTKNACDTAALTDQLRTMKANSKALEGAAKVVPEVAPDAIVQCGDDLMKASEWQQAKDRYQQLLDDYPDHKLKARATEGVTKATQAIELAKVRALLTPKGSAQPAYCTNPAPYSAAPAYGAQHPNRSLVYGADEYTSRLPGDWKAGDAADAVLIVCANPPEFGAAVETCTYESLSAPGVLSNITFHRIVIPVRVIELRTAKVITDARVDIGGVSCPQFIQGMETGMFVQPSDGDIHAGFAPLIW